VDHFAVTAGEQDVPDAPQAEDEPLRLAHASRAATASRQR